MLISVQYARAFAALLVVSAHFGGFDIFRPLDFGEFGGVGVDIFFVISGFIMWETSKDQSPANFAWRRISRIVPAYWFYTTLLVFLALVAPQVTPKVQLDAAQLLSSYLFIPHANQRGEINPLLLQGWTLNYEMFFYLVFGLTLFFSRRLTRLVILAGFFIAAAVAGAFVSKDDTVLFFYLSPMLLEFLFGIAVSILARSIGRSVAFGLPVLVVGIAALVAVLVTQSVTPRFLAFGLPSALILLGLVSLEDLIRRRPVGLLVMIGDASYSLYLSHPFALSLVARMLKFVDQRILSLPGAAGALVFGLLALVASVAIALLSYAVMEKPIGRYLNSFFRKQRYETAPPVFHQPNT